MMTLIANPSSRSGQGRRLWDSWERALREQGAAYGLRVTSSRGDCEKAAREASLAGNTVVAVGGDGTINAVINGMLRAGSGSPSPLGVLYAGTSPDFCRFHHIPTDAQAAMRTLLAGHSILADMASLRFEDGKGGNATAFFACGCNIGLGAATAAFANSWRKYLGDTAGTGLGLVKAIATHKPFAGRLAIDEERVAFEHVNHIMILKNPHIASGLRLNLDLAPADGSLCVVVLHGHSSLALLRLLPLLYSGRLAGQRGVYVKRCASVRVETTPVQSVEFDGDPQGFSPAAARVLPRALPLIVPYTSGEPHA